MTFAKFWTECISIFGTRSKRVAKTTVSTSAVKNEMSKADQSVESADQIHKEKKKRED